MTVVHPAKKKRLGAFDTVVLIYAAAFVLVCAVQFVLQRAYGIRSCRPYILPLSGFAYFFFDLLLVWLIAKTIKRAEIQLERRDWLLWAITVLVAAAYCAYSLLARKFIPYWDYAVYYHRQLNLVSIVQGSGLLGSMRDLYGTISSDYSMFLSIFVHPLFLLTGQTHVAFIACVFAVFVPALFLLLLSLMKKLQRLLALQDSFLFVAISYPIACATPFLYASFLLGQPDLCGLIFALGIILLTVDYDFRKLDLPRLLLLAAHTVCVLVARRWYAFGCLAYFVCYAAWLIYRNFRDQQYRAFGRIAVCVLACAAGIALLLLPMLRQVFSYDYAGHYVFYKGGGFGSELESQPRVMGLLWFAASVLGLMIGIWKRNRLALLGGAGLLLAMVMFTRVQQMGNHHYLLEAPFFWMLQPLLVAALVRSRRWIRCAGLTALCGVMALNLAGSAIASSALRSSDAFTSISLVPVQNDHMDSVQAVDEWIVQNCNGTDRTVYMIPHSGYCIPNEFGCAALPDRTVLILLPYGSAIPGTHAFPVELLDAYYVLTADPFPELGLSTAYNEVFLDLVRQGYFEAVQTFDFHADRRVTAYRRLKPTDAYCVQRFTEAVADVSEQFPDMYKDVLEQYAAEHRLS